MEALECGAPHEWSFAMPDLPDGCETSVRFTIENGRSWLVPAFAAGGGLWKVRFAPEQPGVHRFEIVCCGGAASAFRGAFRAVEYHGPNTLLAHGPLRVSDDGRTFEQADGTPFFWLADTWWMALSERLEWPDGFLRLALDRCRKGFSVVQMVAGPYPDMEAFDPRAKNEAGFSWDESFGRINDRYYDYADRRIACLVGLGLVPCIVGCWGYHLLEMGVEKVKRHWRNLIARYGSYPVVWCLAGEAGMPYYLSPAKEQDSERLVDGWTQVARYVRETDPFGRLITIHPRVAGRREVADPSLLDFEMLQTGHGDRQSLPQTIETLEEAVAVAPRVPVIDAEVCYEGIGEACRQEVQRLMFWACLLNGAAGHTYGANGLWQVNSAGRPYGASPHGLAWGGPTWEEAMALPGSRQLGLAKALLQEYPWWKMEPHPEWVDAPADPAGGLRPWAAGIPGKLRFVYWPSSFGAGTVCEIEAEAGYAAFLFDPVTGERTPLGPVEPDEKGRWTIPCGRPPWRVMPVYQDWVLVMEAPALRREGF